MLVDLPGNTDEADVARAGGGLVCGICICVATTTSPAVEQTALLVLLYVCMYIPIRTATTAVQSLSGCCCSDNVALCSTSSMLFYLSCASFFSCPRLRFFMSSLIFFTGFLLVKLSNAVVAQSKFISQV